VNRRIGRMPLSSATTSPSRGEAMTSYNPVVLEDAASRTCPGHLCGDALAPLRHPGDPGEARQVEPGQLLDMIEQLSRKLWAHQRVELDPTLLAVVRDLSSVTPRIWSEKRSFVTPSISSPFQWDLSRLISGVLWSWSPCIHPPSTSSTERSQTTRRRRAGRAMAPAISSGCPCDPSALHRPPPRSTRETWCDTEPSGSPRRDCIHADVACRIIQRRASPRG